MNLKSINPRPKISIGPVVVFASALLSCHQAQAHLTYSGRDLGSFSGLAAETRSITNQAVTGNYGWADAADANLGDSHRARAFRFHLGRAALVTVTVSANANATTNSLGDFTPAFSVYSGLAGIAPFPPSTTALPAAADHDGSEASETWRTWWAKQSLDPNATDASATDGSWNAVGNWMIGGDGDLPGDFAQLSSFIYRGSATSSTSGGTVSQSYGLPAGDYTIMVGGNDLENKTADTALLPRGLAVTLAVTPTPVLTIAPKVFVAWPAGTPAHWVLQAGATIDGTVWNAVTNHAVVVDGVPGVVLDAEEASQYFRFTYVP